MLTDLRKVKRFGLWGTRRRVRSTVFKTIRRLPHARAVNRAYSILRYNRPSSLLLKK